MRHIIILFMVYSALIGCVSNHSENKNQKVFYNSYTDDTLSKTDTIYLSKTIKNDTLSFVYKLKPNTDILSVSFVKSIDNDSSINLYGETCHLVSSKIFKVKNHDYEILKYYYDDESSIDEEARFFYHQDYGLLVGFNNGWMDLIFSMEYDNISKILVDSILSDRSIFYQNKIPSPPPPQDSLMIIFE